MCIWSEFEALAKRPRKSTQVNASQHKFVKPELAYGLAKGGQTDSQVGSLVAKSRKFHAYHWLMQITCDQLVSTCAGWPNDKKLASTSVQI